MPASDCITQTAYLTNSLYWLNFCFNVLFSSFFQRCIGGVTRGKGAVIPSCEGELGNICIHTEYVVEKGRGWGEEEERRGVGEPCPQAFLRREPRDEARDEARVGEDEET